jgi:hypothetical protein
MRAAIWLLLSGGLIAVFGADPVVLRTLSWRVVSDSLQVDFGFAHGRPDKYRVLASPEVLQDKNLVVEFSGVKLDDGSPLKMPSWAKVLKSADAGLLAIEIDLKASTPWKINWNGDSLQLKILNQVRSPSIWKNPWLVGGLGASFLAGGTAFWLLGTDHGKPTTGGNLIPPPDVSLPQ